MLVQNPSFIGIDRTQYDIVLHEKTPMVVIRSSIGSGIIHFHPNDVPLMVEALNQVRQRYLEGSESAITSESHMSKDGFPGYPAE